MLPPLFLHIGAGPSCTTNSLSCLGTNDDHEQFKLINEAYQILSDEQKREMYDKYGKVEMHTLPQQMRFANCALFCLVIFRTTFALLKVARLTSRLHSSA
jgi:curved DNA-binding protein CbpA